MQHAPRHAAVASFIDCHPDRTSVREGPAVLSSLKGLADPLANATQRFRAGLKLGADWAHTFRAALLICSIGGVVLLSGCGHKKTARTIPPPPTITSSTAPATSTEASTKAPAPSVETGKHQKPIYVETGLASWYGPPYHNRRGANGEVYDQNALTAAHRTLPMNSVVRVTNESTKHAVVVRITDRGPFIEDRMIDLSLAAAKAVDVWRPGTATVKIEVLSAPAPIFDGGRWCVQIGAFQSRHDALKLKTKLQDKYENAQVIEFTGPTGEWVRIRPQGDDKRTAQEVASKTHVKEGGVFLVRLD